MSAPRRAALLASIALFAAAGVAWVLSVPERLEQVYAAIPADAALVVELDRPAGQLADLIARPEIRDVLTRAGLSTESLAAATDDPAAARWFHRLAGRRAVLAYVPHLASPGAHEAWIFATWIGGDSQRLRWQTNFGPPPGFRRVTVRPFAAWTANQPLGTSRKHLSLALTEGMLLGCVSADPTGVRVLLETVDGYPWRPSALTEGNAAAARALWAAGPAAARGWVRGPDGVSSLLAWTLNASGPDDATLDAAVLAPDAPPAIGYTRAAESLAGALGDRADAVALLPATILRPWIGPDICDAAETLLGPAAGTGWIAVALMDADHGGHLRGPIEAAIPPGLNGLSVPAIVVGAWTGGLARVEPAAVQRRLIPWNERWDAGLHLHPAANTVGIYRLEDALPGLYHALEPGEQFGLAARGGWRLAATHVGVLAGLCQAPPANPAPWLARWNAEPGAIGGAWCRPPAAGQTLRGAMAVASMATDGGTTRFARDLRETLPVLSAGLGILERYATVDGALIATGRLARMHLVFQR